MKRFLKFCFISVILIMVIGCSACNFDLFNGCGSNSNQVQTVEPIIIHDNTETDFTMIMVEKDSFYYPTIEGKVKLDFVPNKIEVLVDGNSSFYINHSDYTNLSWSGEKYIIAFSKVHVFGSLEEGEYRITLAAYNDNVKYIIDKETVFAVDDLYTGMWFFKWETGESFYAMDKESNWVGPF